MAGYSTLVGARSTDGSIKNWVNNSLIPATTVLTEAEAEIYKRLRVREMLTSTTGTLAIGADTITLPDRYRAAYSFMFTGIYKDVVAKRLIYEVEEMWEYDSDGDRVQSKPQFYAATESVIQFDVPADIAYPWRHRYYQALAPLAESTNETNFITEKYPTMLRYACLYRAWEHLRNTAERNYYRQMMESEIYQTNQESDLEMAGAELVMTVE